MDPPHLGQQVQAVAAGGRKAVVERNLRHYQIAHQLLDNQKI